MGKVINPRTGAEQPVEVHVTEPVTRELDAVLVIEHAEDSR
jgi:hypothetical protein